MKAAMANEKFTGKIKEELFEDFFHTAWNSLWALEIQFSIEGVRDQVFGKDVEEPEAKENLRNSNAWKTLTRVYDYAVNGVEPEADTPDSIVIDGSDVLKLVASENHWTSEAWDNIIAMGDGRFALDEGSPVDLYKVALLANVDVRTIRNAVSAGDLISFKSGEGGRILIENASARRWLHGRRGFKPTVMQSSEEMQRLDTVTTPAEFAAFLSHRRNQLGFDDSRDKLVVMHPSATPEAISQLESGVFSVPLDAAFPIADFYQLDRKTFLQCVMRVFFYEEMRMLSEDGKVGEK
jgi:hypothetical protein